MSGPFRRGVGLIALGLCLLAPLNAGAGDVTVSLADGRATVVARNATLRQVLAEWARVGGTRIVNLERVAGAPDSFELRNVPEARALAMLLRSVAGYIAAPRTATSRGASIYDRILILPTSVASVAPASPLRAGPAPPPPVYEPAPDPTALANDDSNDTIAITAAPGAFQGNGQEGVTPGPPAGPPPPMTMPGVTPYSPNPADPASALTGQPSAPPTMPNAGQYIAPQPGVPPTPPTQQQPKP